MLLKLLQRIDSQFVLTAPGWMNPNSEYWTRQKSHYMTYRSFWPVLFLLKNSAKRQWLQLNWQFSKRLWLCKFDNLTHLAETILRVTGGNRSINNTSNYIHRSYSLIRPIVQHVHPRASSLQHHRPSKESCVSLNNSVKADLQSRGYFWGHFE